MICIFCQQDSGGFARVEHIIPESLGNKTHTLPPGIVCDRCNQYFGSKIEGPVLASGTFKALRFHQTVASKKKRLPVMDALVWPESDARTRVVLPVQPDRMPIMSVTPQALARIFEDGREGNPSLLVFPPGDEPEQTLMSRFLAKCALEALAARLLAIEGEIQVLATDPRFDPIRNHARIGRPPAWPFTDRIIYGVDDVVVHRGEQPVQTMFEFDLLATNPENVNEEGAVVSEVYFVLAVFGREFAINLAGPEVEGYEHWLAENGRRSPLYAGRNAAYTPPSPFEG